MQASELRFGIVGGGPGGLLTAIALKRKGFKNIFVFERDQDAESRAQGYSFSLFKPKGGLVLIEELGLSDELDAFSFDSQGFRMIDGSSAKILFEFLRTPDAKEIGKRVMRTGLRKWLVAVCEREGISITWNSRVLKYEEKQDSVKVIFENGERREFDILIGADGIHSPIREQLVGDELKYTGYTCITGITHRKNALDLFSHQYFDHAGMLATAPAKTVFNFHHPPDEQFWGLTVPVPEHYFEQKCGDDLGNLKLEVLARLDGLDPLFTELLLKGEVKTILPFYDRDPVKIDRKTGRAFHSKSGRITLLGDAAHPMVPFRAAGGNSAILDARQLVHEMSTLLEKSSPVTLDDIATILRKFESEMIARTTPEVLGSRKAMHMMHSSNQFMIKLRNAGMAFGNWKMNSYSKNKKLQMIVKGVSMAVTVGALYGAVCLAKRTQFFTNYVNYFCDVRENK